MSILTFEKIRLGCYGYQIEILEEAFCVGGGTGGGVLFFVG